MQKTRRNCYTYAMPRLWQTAIPYCFTSFYRVIIEHARDPSSRRDFSYGFRRDRSPDRYRSSRLVIHIIQFVILQ